MAIQQIHTNELWYMLPCLISNNGNYLWPFFTQAHTKQTVFINNEKREKKK